MKIEPKKIIQDDLFSPTFHEIPKKLNILSDKLDENERKNDERYLKILELQYKNWL